MITTNKMQEIEWGLAASYWLLARMLRLKTWVDDKGMALPVASSY